MTTTETRPAPSAPPPAARRARSLARKRRKLALRRGWEVYRRSWMGLAGLAILIFFVGVALCAPLLADPAGLDPVLADGPITAPPSAEYPLGTDDLGRSVLTLVIWGSRESLLVGFLAAVVCMVVGSGLGILAGYRGGGIDAFLMRLTDWFLVLPFIPLAVIIAGIFGPSLPVRVLVIGLISWPWTARLVRSQTLSVKERPFIERARGLGASDRTVIRKHVFPNVLPVIFANTILQVALMILATSTLAFLGLGDPLSPSWGTTLENAFAAGAPTLGAWWWIGSPGVCIVLVVLAFTMCGNAIEEIVNPRLRQR